MVDWSTILSAKKHQVEDAQKGHKVHKMKSFLKYISIIKRDTNRFFNIKLKKFNLGGGQQFFLIRIWENPGITMYDLARKGGFDKATVTKAVGKLMAEGYVVQETDPKDRRVKRLKVTDDAKAVVDYIYKIRDEWILQIIKDIPREEVLKLYEGLEKMALNSSASICEMNKMEKNNCEE